MELFPAATVQSVQSSSDTEQQTETLQYPCNALCAVLKVALLPCLDEPGVLCKAAGIQKEWHTMLLA